MPAVEVLKASLEKDCLRLSTRGRCAHEQGSVPRDGAFQWEMIGQEALGNEGKEAARFGHLNPSEDVLGEEEVMEESKRALRDDWKFSFPGWLLGIPERS